MMSEKALTDLCSKLENRILDSDYFITGKMLCFVFYIANSEVSRM